MKLKKLEKIKTDWDQVILLNFGSLHFPSLSQLFLKVIFIMLGNHPCLLCGCNFASKRLALPILKFRVRGNENKQNCRDYIVLSNVGLKGATSRFVHL